MACLVHLRTFTDRISSTIVPYLWHVLCIGADQMNAYLLLFFHIYGMFCASDVRNKLSCFYHTFISIACLVHLRTLNERIASTVLPYLWHVQCINRPNSFYNTSRSMACLVHQRTLIDQIASTTLPYLWHVQCI